MPFYKIRSTGRKQKAFYFKGEAIESCAYGQNEADNKDVIVDEVIKEKLVSKDYQFEEKKSPFYKLIRKKKALLKVDVINDLPTAK